MAPSYDLKRIEDVPIAGDNARVGNAPTANLTFVASFVASQPRFVVFFDKVYDKARDKAVR